jgi:hypothetical protein
MPSIGTRATWHEGGTPAGMVVTPLPYPTRLATISKSFGGVPMFRALTILGLLTLTVLPACATAKGESHMSTTYDISRLKKIAVVDGNNPSFQPQVRQVLMDSFQYEFFKKGWNPVERSNIQAAIDEMGFQNSEFTSQTDRKQIGSILNVQAIVVVNIASAGDEISITTKMFDVETGEIIWMGTGDGDIKAGSSALLGVLGGVAVGAAIGDSAGGIAGGIAGAAMGTYLTPSEMENAKKVVTRVCEMIPLR